MNPPPTLSRRALLQGITSIGVVGSASLAGAKPAASAPTMHKGATIVFQGDSITDEGRKRDITAANHSAALGKGYAAMISGQLLGSYSDLELQCYNRGISGHKVPDLAARWQSDTLDLKPDLLSILIGVNDLWHKFAFGTNYQGTVKDYEDGYRALVKQTLESRPSCRVVICEPFTTRTSKEFAPLADYAVAAKTVANEFQLTFVPFQSVFNQALKAAPAEFWLWDGVHPTPAGHALMCQAWRQAVGV